MNDNKTNLLCHFLKVTTTRTIQHGGLYTSHVSLVKDNALSFICKYGHHSNHVYEGYDGQPRAIKVGPKLLGEFD